MVEKLSNYRLQPDEIPQKLDPRSTKEILDELLAQVSAVANIHQSHCATVRGVSVWCDCEPLEGPKPA
jgi:hypothetical protein